MRDVSKWKFDALNEGPAKWDPNVPVLEQSSRLEIKPLANTSGNHYNGYVSLATWDMTNARASITVLQTTDSSSFADTVFAIGTDSSNWYRFVYEQGQLYFQQKVAGTKTSTNVTFNAVLHHFWRFRHDPSTDSMVFETSPDGTSWTAQRTVVRAIPITALRFELDAGTGNPEASPGFAIFDDFQMVAGPAPSPTPTPNPSATPTPTPTPRNRKGSGDSTFCNSIAGRQQRRQRGHQKQDKKDLADLLF